MIKKVYRRTRAGAGLIKREGALSFSIKLLQKVQSRRQTSSITTPTQQNNPIYTRVKYSDAIAIDPLNGPSAHKASKSKSLTLSWVMPPPGKGSGGHHNIFRFIKFLEDAGHTCRIYLYTQIGTSPINDIKLVMDSYPDVNAKMKWIEKPEDIEDSDGIFATSWETAYPIYNSKAKGKRFYFVQDFEPYFYPLGSLYALAENSYKFNFYGVTAGNWLSTKLKRDYGMQTDYFDFGADPGLYSLQNTGKRKEIMFYARPYTERRGFEVGIMALGLFHELHPDYTINIAGWDISEYDIPFPYVNLKTLELSELNELYNRCAAGLVLSFTNMSLLPLELLKSGTIPVVNDAENNRLVSNNKFIAYSNNDPFSLAQTLSKIVSRKDAQRYSKAASKSILENGWEQSGEKFVGIIEREVRKNG